MRGLFFDIHDLTGRLFRHKFWFEDYWILREIISPYGDEAEGVFERYDKPCLRIRDNYYIRPKTQTFYLRALHLV
jgi:hypothetical protein